MQVTMTMEEYEFLKNRADEWHHLTAVSQKIDAWRDAIRCPESWEVLDWITHLRSMTETSIMVLNLPIEIEKKLAKQGLTTVRDLKRVILDRRWGDGLGYTTIPRSAWSLICTAYDAYVKAQSADNHTTEP